MDWESTEEQMLPLASDVYTWLMNKTEVVQPVLMSWHYDKHPCWEMTRKPQYWRISMAVCFEHQLYLHQSLCKSKKLRVELQKG